MTSSAPATLGTTGSGGPWIVIVPDARSAGTGVEMIEIAVVSAVITPGNTTLTSAPGSFLTSAWPVPSVVC